MNIALVDMDGTLCDYNGTMDAALAPLRAPGEPVPGVGEPWPPHVEARRKLVGRIPGFWRDLPPLPLGFRIVEALQAHGFALMVLTKGPSWAPHAWGEKVAWCHHHLPNVGITVATEKALTYGRVLVDDWPPYYRAWLSHRPRGVVLVPAQPWNVGAEDADPARIVRVGPDDLDRVHRVLARVAARADGEVVDVRDA